MRVPRVGCAWRAPARRTTQKSDRLLPESRKRIAESGQPIAESPCLRIKFRIWPGQGGVIETVLRQRVIQRMRSIEPSYQDWMVAVHCRVEPAFTRRAVSALEVFRKRRGK